MKEVLVGLMGAYILLKIALAVFVFRRWGSLVLDGAGELSEAIPQLGEDASLG